MCQTLNNVGKLIEVNNGVTKPFTSFRCKRIYIQKLENSNYTNAKLTNNEQNPNHLEKVYYRVICSGHNMLLDG